MKSLLERRVNDRLKKILVWFKEPNSENAKHLIVLSRLCL